MTYDDDIDDVGNVVHFDPRAPWQSRCEKNAKGKLIPNEKNVLMALRFDPDLRDAYGYDEMQRRMVMLHELGRIDVTTRWVGDADFVYLTEWLQGHGMPSVSLATARNALCTRAEECPYHPVVSYLNSLIWDGVPRLGVWLTSYLGAALGEPNASIGRMFLTAMVARVMLPGCQADYMPVLEGPQGILKSSACRVLGGEWFSDHLPDIKEKDVSVHLRGKWLIEVAEMHAMSKVEATQLKSFITRQIEIYRVPFGRLEVREPRQCVFVGTTNESQYLKDASGGRRFWPVECGVSGRINLDLLAYNRDQLFAEAKLNYENQGAIYPDAAFEREYLMPAQAARYAGDIWEDKVAQFLDGREQVTIPEIAREALFVIEGQMADGHNRRIASILRGLGWASTRVNSKRFWKRLQ